MVKQELEDFLTEEEYVKIPSNLSEFTIFFHQESNYINVLNVIDYRNDIYLMEDKYEKIKNKIKQLFREKNICDIHILSLIVSEDGEKVRKFCGKDSFCWQLDPAYDRLIIYENQVSDFYGIKDRLEEWLLHLGETKGMHEEEAALKIPEKVKIPAMTTVFVSLNVIIFLICTFTGDMLYNIGAFSIQNIIADKEYYRVVTAMFLHWDINHLFSNMLILYFIGEVVEKRFGAVKYGTLYLLSGICGNLLSAGYEMLTQTFTQSAGASGAVFGVIGALLFLVVAHKGRLEHITLTRLLIMIFYSLYSGFAGSDINNAAHVGGFLSGILIAVILWLISGKNNLERERTR